MKTKPIPRRLRRRAWTERQWQNFAVQIAQHVVDGVTYQPLLKHSFTRSN
jgi:hypothetical protein